MKKLKTQTKLLIAFAMILFAICLFNNNTVNAVEVTEEYLQNMLDVLPEEMNVDVPEIEFEKAGKIVEDNAKRIWQEQGIDITGININIGSISQAFLTGNKEDFNIARIVLSTNTIYTNKNINIVYNNHNNYNSTDESYVRNLTIEPKKYYEFSFESYDKQGGDIFQYYVDTIKTYYTNLINDSSIDIQVFVPMGGNAAGLNAEVEGNTWIGIFKNGVFYDVKSVGVDSRSIPVIHIPSNISDNEVNNYIINLIKKYPEKYGDTIASIEKGTKNKGNYAGDTLDIDIPDGYTVKMTGEHEGGVVYIIVKRDTAPTTNTVTSTDSNTNIKLEATEGVIPSNTILEVAPITEGTTFDRVKNAISNVSKFKIFDINLLSNGVKIQPNGNVKISIPIPEGFDTSKLVVYRIEDNGNKIEYKVTIEGNYATFETDHFSTYVLAEEETKQGEKDDTPKTGIEKDNTITYAVGIIAVFGIAILIINRKNI